MQIEVIEALVCQSGWDRDLILLWVKLPCPFVEGNKLQLKMECRTGEGWEYFCKHFPRTKYVRMCKNTDGKFDRTEGVTDDYQRDHLEIQGEGYNAFMNGEPVAFCPYAANLNFPDVIDERTHWLTGWYNARQEVSEGAISTEEYCKELRSETPESTQDSSDNKSPPTKTDDLS